MTSKATKGTLGSGLTGVVLGAILGTQAHAVPPMDGKAQNQQTATAPAASATGAATTAAVGAAAAGSAAGEAGAPAKPARRAFGTIAQAPWIAAMDRIQGFDPGEIHIIGEFGTNPKALTVRYDGKTMPFELINSSLMLVRPIDIKAQATLEVQLGEVVTDRRWARGSFEPSSIQTLFQPRSEGPMGHLLAWSEERDIRPDGEGGWAFWGNRIECYRLVDYNRMVAKAYDMMPEDPELVAGSYAKALPPVSGAAAARSQTSYSSSSKKAS